MAFPSASRKDGDINFLKPYKPEEFASGQVHVERASDSGFLFRIDILSNSRAAIVVQSATCPDWEYAFHNADHFLAGPPEVRQVNFPFEHGQKLKFCLLGNPTRRLSERSLGADGNPVENGIGKRVPVPDDRLCDWLDRRGQSHGFAIDKGTIVVQPGYLYINKGGKGQGRRLRSARYDGILQVEDTVRFKEALVQGIGSGKAFGFGLLSVALLKKQSENKN